jgi:hypothetical protein
VIGSPSASSSSTADRVPFTPPFPASWFDHLAGWIDRLPIPWWLFYLLVAVALEAIQAFILWQDGIFSAFGVHFFQLFFPISYILALFLMHGLDRQAGTSLERFRPALHPGPLSYSRLRYELTTLPARPTILAGLAGLAFGFLTTATMPVGLQDYPMFGMNTSTSAFTLMLISFPPTLWLWFTFVYHTIHQLRTVHRIYTTQTQVNLYRLRPIYALAELTALTALGFAIYTYPWLSDPGMAGATAGGPPLEYNLVLTLPFYVWPIAIFVWPLWGAHRILVHHKDQALACIGHRMDSVTSRFHDHLERDPLAGMDEFHKALATLELEAAALEKIPTWPWPRGMFRNLMAAFLLPVLIWLIQYVLQRVLG